jgi:beta-lactamase superfamily II metal-dependent hydrolase
VAGRSILVVVFVFLLLALAGCAASTAGSGNDSGRTGDSAVTEPSTPRGAQTGTAGSTATSAEGTVEGTVPTGDLLSVTFMDVGQGSSALIRLPNGGNVLVDGGPREGGPDRVEDLRRLGVSRLDAVVISHADEDHAGGLVDVIRTFPVGAVYDSGYPHTTQTYNDLLRAVRDSGARYVQTRTGETIGLDPNVRMEFVYPDELGEGTNESSLALRLDYGSFAAQFTGDLGIGQEEDLLTSGRLSPVTLLEVGHHGSASSSSGELLEALSPEVGVIQVGENNYGHPTEEALSRLAAAGVEVYRTDQQGEVTVATNGTDYEASTEAAGGAAAEPVPLPEPGGGAYTGPVATPSSSSGELGCPGFATQEEAQALYERDLSDPNGLDGDGDGEACEHLPPTSGATGASSGGRGSAAGAAGRDYDCSDFESYEEAQQYLLPGDPHDLDRDGDGACDTLR